MELAGRKILMIIGPDFEDREVFYPLYRLREAGALVKIAGIGDKTYKGKYGISLEVDGSCDDFVLLRWDAVIVPGGWAPDKIRINPSALEIVRKVAREGGIVAAICHGPWVLASAQVLKGKSLTSFRNIKDDLVNAGAKWQDAEVVVDGALITARKPDDLPAFCREIVRALAAAPVRV